MKAGIGTAGWILAISCGAVAIIDWFAVWGGCRFGNSPSFRRWEYVLKPLTLLLLVVAVSVSPPGTEYGDARRWFFVVALGLSLLGDIFLILPLDLFTAGLGAFLAAHIAYISGLIRKGGSIDDLLTAIALVAVGLAALMAGKAAGTGTAVVVLSGGNVDPLLLTRLIEHGLSAAGRYFIIRVVLSDRPGSLGDLTSAIGKLGLNLVTVDHRRFGAPIGVNEVEVFLTVETRGPDHRNQIVPALIEEGFRAQERG